VKERFEDWLKEVEEAEGRIEQYNGLWWVFLDIRRDGERKYLVPRQYIPFLQKVKGSE
jgi:hypothetical protein